MLPQENVQRTEQTEPTALASANLLSPAFGFAVLQTTSVAHKSTIRNRQQRPSRAVCIGTVNARVEGMRDKR
jgi:hypothetical protein